MRILGLDPGSRLTGYGCIDWVSNRLVYVADGVLKLAPTSGRAEIPVEERLFALYEGLSAVILTHKPEAIAVEKVFVAKNALSALKLGQARGAIILTARIHGLKVFEYSSAEVKSAVAGYGQADKIMVARMITLLTGRRDFVTLDASDGLALAVCHALHSRVSLRPIPIPKV